VQAGLLADAVDDQQRQEPGAGEQCCDDRAHQGSLLADYASQQEDQDDAENAPEEEDRRETACKAEPEQRRLSHDLEREGDDQPSRGNQDVEGNGDPAAGPQSDDFLAAYDDNQSGSDGTLPDGRLRLDEARARESRPGSGSVVDEIRSAWTPRSGRDRRIRLSLDRRRALKW
jgi:hypothetical protein